MPSKKKTPTKPSVKKRAKRKPKLAEPCTRMVEVVEMPASLQEAISAYEDTLRVAPEAELIPEFEEVDEDSEHDEEPGREPIRHQILGRPTGYRPEYDQQAANYCRLGAIDKDLAEFFGVCLPTLYSWKLNFPTFLNAINTAKEPSDDRVKRALYERACGYTTRETKVYIHEGVPILVDVIKEYPPDTAAAFIWMKNRDPENWRNQHDIVVSKEIGITIDNDDEKL